MKDCFPIYKNNYWCSKNNQNELKKPIEIMLSMNEQYSDKLKYIPISSLIG